MKPEIITYFARTDYDHAFPLKNRAVESSFAIWNKRERPLRDLFKAKWMDQIESADIPETLRLELRQDPQDAFYILPLVKNVSHDTITRLMDLDTPSTPKLKQDRFLNLTKNMRGSGTPLTDLLAFHLNMSKLTIHQLGIGLGTPPKGESAVNARIEWSDAIKALNKLNLAAPIQDIENACDESAIKKDRVSNALAVFTTIGVLGMFGGLTAMGVDSGMGSSDHEFTDLLGLYTSLSFYTALFSYAVRSGVARQVDNLKDWARRARAAQHNHVIAMSK